MKQDENSNDPIATTGAIGASSGITIPNKVHSPSDTVNSDKPNQSVTVD